MIKKKIKKAVNYAILTGMAAFGQIARAEAPRMPEKEAAPSNTVVQVKDYVYQRDEGGIFFPPFLITPQQGMQMALAFQTMSDVRMVHAGNVIPVHVEKISKMPQADKQVFLNNLATILEMKTAWDRINKYMEAKGIKNFSNPSGKLPRAFREDVDGNLTTWVVDSKKQTIQEFNFDKNGQEISPKQVGAPKRFYRYHEDTSNFLCIKTSKGEYLAIEMGQMSQPLPTFTYQSPERVQYMCLFGSTCISDGKNIRAYRGSIQELQREKELQEKAKTSQAER